MLKSIKRKTTATEIAISTLNDKRTRTLSNRGNVILKSPLTTNRPIYRNTMSSYSNHKQSDAIRAPTACRIPDIALKRDASIKPPGLEQQKAVQGNQYFTLRDKAIF